MKKIHFISAIVLTLFYSKTLSAQDSLPTLKRKTVSIEEMIGDQRQVSQLFVNSVFTEKTKAGLLSISAYAADYKDSLSNNEFQNVSLLYHPLFKGISVNSGTSFTSIEGLKNFVGLQYMLQKKSLSIVLISSYFYTRSHKVSNLAIVEYKPAFNENWAFYSRIQGHYNQNVEKGTHFRSYVYSRFGLTYKYFSFGLAHNYDCYGATKHTKNNYGIFLKLML